MSCQHFMFTVILISRSFRGRPLSTFTQIGPSTCEGTAYFQMERPLLYKSLAFRLVIFNDPLTFRWTVQFLRHFLTIHFPFGNVRKGPHKIAQPFGPSNFSCLITLAHDYSKVKVYIEITCHEDWIVIEFNRYNIIPTARCSSQYPVFINNCTSAKVKVLILVFKLISSSIVAL